MNILVCYIGYPKHYITVDYVIFKLHIKLNNIKL